MADLAPRTHAVLMNRAWCKPVRSCLPWRDARLCTINLWNFRASGTQLKASAAQSHLYEDRPYAEPSIQGILSFLKLYNFGLGLWNVQGFGGGYTTGVTSCVLPSPPLPLAVSQDRAPQSQFVTQHKELHIYREKDKGSIVYTGPLSCVSRNQLDCACSLYVLVIYQKK